MLRCGGGHKHFSNTIVTSLAVLWRIGAGTGMGPSGETAQLSDVLSSTYIAARGAYDSRLFHMERVAEKCSDKYYQTKYCNVS